MSLHIGNLSSNIRGDDLHRVFRRFGRCTIQVKDKYGFVVYDYPAGAEKALKTLRGKRICGQAITVSWSRQQPHRLQRFDRRLCSYDRDKEMDSKKADVETRINSSKLVGESISKNPDESKLYVGGSSRTFLTDRHSREGARVNLLEEDSWAEKVVDPSNEYNLENSVKFDRYEPYHSDGQKEFDEIGGSMKARKEFRDKKRNRREYESQDKNHIQRETGSSSSSSFRSDYTLCRSKSPSRSVRILSEHPTHSKLKSASWKKNSPSSLGPSPSHHSRSKTFDSLPTSRSMSTTSSPLPLEVNRNVSSSPIERQKDPHSLNSFEEEPQVTSYTGSFRPEKIVLAEENKCETKPAALDLKKDPSEKDNVHSHSTFKDSHDLVLQNAKGMSDSQNKEHDKSLRSNSSDSLIMSSEEVCTILKHYGLQHQEVNEKNLPVEAYFGSARLWPWEIIYYRRLKKGPISTENYSRRIAQNEEFGIVDRYIRSSSGWGEPLC